LGFNNKGGMVKSRAVVASQIHGQNATIAEFNLTSRDPSGVAPSLFPVAKKTQADYAGDGTLTFVFSMPITYDDGIQTAAGNITNFIYAIGPPPDSDGNLPMHSQVGVASVSLKDGTVSSDSERDLRSIQVLVHAILMTVAFLILTPMGIFFAAPGIREKLFPGNRSSNPRHTAAHRNIMMLVVLLACVAFGIGWFVIGSRSFKAHFFIGTIVAGFVALQCVLGVYRMAIKPGDPRMRDGFMQRFGKENKDYFIFLHEWIGRLVWLLAAVNTFYGLQAFSEFGMPHLIAALALTAIGAFLLLAGSIFGVSSRGTTQSNSESPLTHQAGDEKIVESIQEPSEAHIDT